MQNKKKKSKEIKQLEPNKEYLVEQKFSFSLFDVLTQEQKKKLGVTQKP